MDYQYMSNSPCIDSGNPDFLDPDNTRSDIGAVFYNQSTECAISGDVNNDSIVNVLDIVQIINFILFFDNENSECYDVNGDGTTDILDVVSTINIILNV